MSEEHDAPSTSFISHILETMPEGGRQFWLDARYRHVLLGDVVAGATVPGREDLLDGAVASVDQAIEVGLSHLGIPRGPINLPVRVEPRAVGRNAAKYEDCRLVFSSSYFRMLPRYYSSLEPAFRTWLHESIHARQPYDPSWRVEFEPWEGYEEGLADGMANILCSWAKAFIPETTDYVAYVQAYRALAAVLQVSLWALLRQIWDAPTGRVRETLLTVVDEQYHKLTGLHLSTDAVSRLRRIADTLFTTGRTEIDRPDGEVEELWTGALE
jgi:hypothetical protein